jgi:hypothetical protein
MTEAAPAEQPVEAEKKKRLFHRIPTSLLVTLLGIALTAWLLPAFKQQWDDRQKALELKTALAAQIADATARALIRSNPAFRTAGRLDPGKSISELTNGAKGAKLLEADARLNRLWLTDRIAIDAKLRAYFKSPDVVAALASYQNTMRALFSVATFPWAKYPNDPRMHQDFPPAEMARRLGVPTATLVNDLESVRNGLGDAFGNQLAAEVAFDDISNGVLKKENAFIDTIFEAHVDGYSTTAHDLIHNLIP